MAYQPIRLPSMTGLRVLLAIAERGSTTAAADSINLSQSAVSKQLLSLETLLGGPVFTRLPTGMVPTELGQIYIEHARIAVKAMEDAALRALRLGADPKTLRLQVLPIFGDRWLLPRFADFAQRHPDIDLQFTTFVSETQFEPPDGVFRYGQGQFPGEDAIYLLGRDVILACTPGYEAKLGGPERLEDFAQGTMLEHPQTPLHWSTLAAAYGLPELEPRHRMRFGYYTMVIRAALSGQGMALIPRKLIEEELLSGALVNPGGIGFLASHGYWFCVNNSLPRRAALRIFQDWLQTTVAAAPEQRRAP
ncbi:LysR substrate-binding domain-containing protein [Gemmobacter fulvus]|uniref:LysR substrate-binding domain-containing protein n=1 Tax=Gemmobacter fulvus TaxID=2840474 RepID=UPI0027965D81|nr:LysR substrate-binding domain-containing protein [Gemmobacter fulvus]MDQ1850167.1 LysR substrate-binding domain-containing protein [Gemmobacter fulvus]